MDSVATVNESTSDKTPKYQCFICDKNLVRLEDWDLESLKFIYGDVKREDLKCLKLCKKHLEFCEKRIPELETIQTAQPKLPNQFEGIPNAPSKPFLPKKVETGKNFHEKTEREPGEDG